MNPLPLHREGLGLWLNEAGLTGAMTEIGCAFGGFSKIMLSSWKGQKYIMVDPWVHQDENVYKERQEEAWKYLHWFEECSAIAGADKRVEMLRMLSHNAAQLVPDESLSCAYIDGNHSMEAVSEDLLDWWPKVKPGGLFCGHDFYDRTDDGHWCQVYTAVMDWANKNKFPVLTTLCSSWWIRKPI